VQGGESLLVFTQFAELGGWLQAHLRRTLDAPVHFLHGGTSRPARERMIEAFQAPDGPPAVFVLSLKAGGVGITLTRANHVFHFDRWWNPAVEDQATDRAFRIGQTRNVFVHKFVTTGTLEERIDTMLEDKRRVAGLAVGADESWLAGLDNQAFRELIALDRAAVRE
jgi:SNF2 family DNA or RNA helicase